MDEILRTVQEENEKFQFNDFRKKIQIDSFYKSPRFQPRDWLFCILK